MKTIHLEGSSYASWTGYLLSVLHFIDLNTSLFRMFRKEQKLYLCTFVHFQNILVCIYSCRIPWYCCTPHQHCSWIFPRYTRLYLEYSTSFSIELGSSVLNICNLILTWIQNIILINLVSFHLRKKYNKQINYTIARPSISRIPRFTWTLVRSLGIAAHCISTAAV